MELCDYLCNFIYNYIVNVVEEGYRLPLLDIPKDSWIKNNKSAWDKWNYLRFGGRAILRYRVWVTRLLGGVPGRHSAVPGHVGGVA